MQSVDVVPNCLLQALCNIYRHIAVMVNIQFPWCVNQRSPIVNSVRDPSCRLSDRLAHLREASAPAGQDAAHTMAALRKELQEAQSQAAQEAGHVAQFKSLAESAEENTSIIQV